MKRKTSRQPPPIFNAGTIINVLGIPVLTAIFIGGGFYFTLRGLPEQLTKETEARETSQKTEAEARDKVRNALIDYAGKTQHSIDTLAAHALVQDEQIKNVNSSLERVVNGLQNIELAVGHAKR